MNEVKIKIYKSFDNATSCSSENQLVIIESVYDEMREAIANQHAIVLNDNERDQVCEKLWQNGHLSQAVIAKKANEIAQRNNARLNLIHVVEYLPPIDTGFDPLFAGNSMIDEDVLVENARNSLEKLSEKAKDNLKKAVDFLVDVIKDNKFD